MKQSSVNASEGSSPHPRRSHARPEGGWLFLSNHLHVLASLSREPQATIREVAASIGITERAASDIVNDLEHGGYLTRTRVGRRNQYELHRELPLRHPLHDHRTIGELLDFLNYGVHS